MDEKRKGKNEVENKKVAKPVQQPRRYSMYDQMNINEKWLDIFIVAVLVLIVAIILWEI